MNVSTNKDRLVMIAARGKVAEPANGVNTIGFDGVSRTLPMMGGVVYNLRLGDSAYGWMGDHVEPEVSLCGFPEDKKTLCALSCVGNETIVVTGAAAGERGVVLGSHGGSNLLVHMNNPDALYKLTINDLFQVKAFGAGLKIQGFENVICHCADPNLVERILRSEGNGTLSAPVAAVASPKVLGSGIGMDVFLGDYDLKTQDRALIAQMGLDELRIGDFVLLQDCMNCYGTRGVKQGATSLGIVVHTDSFVSGHGPGIVNLASAPGGEITGRTCQKHNLVDYINPLQSWG